VSLKREGGGEWSVNDLAEILAKAPDGSTLKTIELTDETLILHFKIPKGWDAEEHAKMAKWFKDQLKPKLPENVFGLITSEEVDLDVHRPKQMEFVALEKHVDAIHKWIEEFNKDYAVLVETVNKLIEAWNNVPVPITGTCSSWPPPSSGTGQT
jgi:hypothetical protein